jgi:hypothetical protein
LAVFSLQTLIIETLQNGACRDRTALVAPIRQCSEGLLDRFERSNFLIDVGDLGRRARPDICSDGSCSRS